MSSLSTLPKGDSAWLLRKSIQRIMQQVSVLETNIGSSTTGNSADTQVIFNDAGTLRGDTGLTYDKSADRLSFGAGICYGLLTSASATITGDLTVDTSTLKVDSTNNRVGIGTASPTQVLTVRGNVLTTAAAGTDSYANVSTDGVQNSYLGFNNSGSTNAAGASNNNTYIGNGNNYGTQIVGNSNILASFGTTGVFNWYDGAGGTRMTLNSTGLGVGTSPSRKLSVSGAGGAMDVTDTTQNTRIRIRSSSSSNFYIEALNSAESAYVTLRLNDTTQIDSSGNVGIGVTPSAWSNSGNIDLVNNFIGISSSGTYGGAIANNAYYNAGWKYKGSNYANLYLTGAGEHKWFTAGVGTVDGTITDFATAKMTLDASGRLLVGPTSANASGGVLQLSSGITFPATQVASSDANTLDDYEEGSWTPVVADASTGGNTGTCTINSAKYVKIGRQVSVQCDISGITTTGMTAGNAFHIRGLPFTSVQGGNGNFYTYRVGRNASTVSSSAFAPDATSHIIFSLFTTNSATTDLLILVSDIVSTSSQIILSVTYFV